MHSPTVDVCVSGSAVRCARLKHRRNDSGLNDKTTVRKNAVPLVQLKRSRRQQTLANRHLNAVSHIKPSSLVFADHSSFGVETFEFLIGNGAVILKGQFDSRVGAKAECLNFLLEDRLSLVLNQKIFTKFVKERV